MRYSLSFRVTEDDSKEENWVRKVGNCVKGSRMRKPRQCHRRCQFEEDLFAGDAYHGYYAMSSLTTYPILFNPSRLSFPQPFPLQGHYHSNQLMGLGSAMSSPSGSEQSPAAKCISLLKEWYSKRQFPTIELFLKFRQLMFTLAS